MVRIIVNLLFIVMVFAGCERMETVDSTYRDYDTAVKADTVGKGKWIPEFLPRSAINIHERHNIDTNEVWLIFHFSYSVDIANIQKACKRISWREVIYPRKGMGTWWPKTLTQRYANIEHKESMYEYYQCEDGGVLAIRGNEVYYWHIGK